MKKLKILLGLLPVLSAAPVIAEPQQINFSTPEESMIADHGMITLYLKSNPTTGYFWRWVPQQNEMNYVDQVNQQYVPFAQQKGFVGGGGYEKWTFKFNKKLMQVPTQITLHMMYGRSHMPVNTPIESFTVLIAPTQ